MMNGWGCTVIEGLADVSSRKEVFRLNAGKENKMSMLAKISRALSAIKDNKVY